MYVTHDQAEAMSLSDRIAVMQGGRIVQVGTPADIYEHPKSEFVAEFLGGSNIVRGRYDVLNRTFESGQLSLTVPAGKWGSSDDVTLAIKPDAVVLEPDSKHSSKLVGKVIEREYLGFTTTFVVEVSGIALRATAISDEFVRGLQKGASVGVSLNWSKVTVLRAGT